MRFFGYLRVALLTTANVLVNGATLGRYVWLEGRVKRGSFANWARRFRYAPRRFAKPTTEGGLVELVRNARSVRVAGSGHSFNSGIVSEETLVSLDDYSGLIWKDPATGQIAVKGGTRVRDVVSLLLEEGLAFEALPSHDAQSIAGILSTDVHGTGRDWGFVNESVVRLKVVNGKGEVHECSPSDDLFKAAVGGIGAVGVISEVVITGRRARFDVEQEVETKTLSCVERDLDRLLGENEHLSLYLFPFARECRVNTWNRTQKGRSALGDVREFARTAADALGAAWVGNFIAYTGLLRGVSSLFYGFERGSNLVLRSDKAFNRTLYHLHQELEFTVPFEDALEVARRFITLYEEMYHLGLPYALLEVRFTPKRERTLIGAGRDRCCAWIDLVLNDFRGFERYYAAAGEKIKQIGARPHLGKFCDAFDYGYLETIHQQNFAEFLALIDQHDPRGLFANDLTRRLFGRGA